jgi:hypothetical protein
MHFDEFPLNFDNWWIIRRRQVDVIMKLPEGFICSITVCLIMFNTAVILNCVALSVCDKFNLPVLVKFNTW